MIHNFIGKQKSDRNSCMVGIIGKFDTAGRIFNATKIISFVKQGYKSNASIFNFSRRNKVTAKMVN